MPVGRIMRSGVMATMGAAAVLAVGCRDAGPKQPGALAITYSTVADRAPFTWGVSVDGGSPHNVSSTDSGSFVLLGVSSGDHHLIVSSLPVACTSGVDDRLVSVPSVDTTQVRIAVRCLSDKAILRVTTSSSGSDLDPDGYALFLGANKAAFLASPNGVLLISVSPGSLVLALKDIEPNCQVVDPTRTITVAARDTVPVNFVASCGSYPIGVVGASFNDPADDTLPNPGNLLGTALDVRNVNVRYASTFLTVTLKLSRVFLNDAFASYVDFDTDENAATGYVAAVNSFGGNAAQGVDSWVLIQGPASVASLFTPLGTYTVRMAMAADSLIVYVPYEKLLDDGNMTVSTVIGTNRPMDIVPNTGSILSHVPAGVSAAHADPFLATTTGAPALRRVPVQWARPTASTRSAPPRR